MKPLTFRHFLRNQAFPLRLSYLWRQVGARFHKFYCVCCHNTGSNGWNRIGKWNNLFSWFLPPNLAVCIACIQITYLQQYLTVDQHYQDLKRLPKSPEIEWRCLHSSRLHGVLFYSDTTTPANTMGIFRCIPTLRLQQMQQASTRTAWNGCTRLRLMVYTSHC